MPKFNLGRLLEGTAYGVLNEILGEFRSDDGYALPSRYEVVLLPPQGSRGKPKGALNNVFSPRDLCSIDSFRSQSKKRTFR